MTNSIHFYSTRDAYGEFSNFAKTHVYLKDKIWPTTEHYFQAQKFATTDPDYEEAIRRAPTAKQAAELGRSRQHPLRPDWESVKEDIMREALWAKFTQHDDLRDLLLGTGDAQIIEHTHKDRYWGDGGDGSGLNRLGALLMEVRARLLEIQGA
jgi:ribA/ribD-fused uncharacterized protein